MKKQSQIRVTHDNGNYLVGFVTNHNSWPGEVEHGPVTTSAIISRNEDGTIETLNTLYTVIQ